jgi:tRNA (cmo5U34)-methyltransferase
MELQENLNKKVIAKAKTLKEKFDHGAEEYDQQRKHVIPCLEDLYQIISDLATLDVSKPKILDLGAGTGLLTSYLYKSYPEGHFTLLDLSEEMLNIAVKRFNYASNFCYVAADYLKHDFQDCFDLVVSSLSIHHLEHQDKEFLYRRIYEILNPGGIFINADQVLGPNQANEDEYQRNWMEKIEVSSLSKSGKKIIYDRMKLDNPSSLKKNLKWLQNAGFEDIDVYYKYYNFVVLYGKKHD